ncbi:MAG TPA: hypothetical protein VKB93_10285 [Thermoanaerobaculia bacterium]|nr:hypothetical protein [Thermoanaerobaculia bacterium]
MSENLTPIEGELSESELQRLAEGKREDGYGGGGGYGDDEPDYVQGYNGNGYGEEEDDESKE